eukprot:gene22794-29513_t
MRIGRRCALIINSPSEKGLCDFILIVADFYEVPARSLLPYYVSPASGGYEAMPDGYIVNGKLSNNWSISIAEIDDRLVTPFTVFSFVANVAQRVSFILDFSNLNSILKYSPANSIRFEGIADVYPTHNSSANNSGLIGSLSNQPLNLLWKGSISLLISSTGNVSYPNYIDSQVL